MKERSVFLIGFMGAGKTTVGKALAARLTRPFVDLDEQIVAQSGAPLTEIFAERGEEYFRVIESQVLCEVAAGSARVIATGGGVVSRAENLQTMRKHGVVLGLAVSSATVRERIAEPGTRPMLPESEEGLEALQVARQPAYRGAHATIDTNGRSVEQVVAMALSLVERLLASPRPAAHWVALGERSYPIFVEEGSLAQLGEVVAPIAKTVAVVSDDNVAPLYAAATQKALKAAGVASTLHVVPAGEPAKALSWVEELANQLAPVLDRSAGVLALGGGVVGDLAGFVAASLFRGISLIAVPTTLLAMIDSALGGKTGVNLAAGKNLVGAFWQPRAVVADPRVLSTLPQRERRAAVGELVKYALLDGEELLLAVEGIVDGLCASRLSQDEKFLADLQRVLERCVGYKAWVVSRDEREQGERALLNLGHTVGHAIEASFGYGAILHGEAVALGIVAACRLSKNLGMAKARLEDRVIRLFERAGLDSDLEARLSDKVLERLVVDKKRAEGKVRFIVPVCPGLAQPRPMTAREIAFSLQL